MLVRCPVVMRVMPLTSGPSSSTATVLPCCVSSYAVVSPAIPAPMTQTSTWRFSSSGPHAGNSVVADQTDSWRGMEHLRQVERTALAKNAPANPCRTIDAPERQCPALKPLLQEPKHARREKAGETPRLLDRVHRPEVWRALHDHRAHEKARLLECHQKLVRLRDAVD